jgi:hypothetical protein
MKRAWNDLSSSGEVPLMQCDKCGSEVSPDEIREEMPDPWYSWKILLIGIILGGLLRQLFTYIQR